MVPKIVDLFSGCGGLTLGFERAGFDVAVGVEIMQEAVNTISYNLDYRYGKEASHLCADITKLDVESFKSKIGKEGCIVIGGPPCQAYSMAGRGKLKSLGEDRHFTKDARGTLYKEFLRFVYGLDARAVVMENVPESTNYGGENIPELVCCELEKNGYNASWTIMNSANYGVPQIRERVILIAVKKTENAEVKFPKPTHMSVNGEYTVYRNRLKKFSESPHFSQPIQGTGLPAWRTVKDALSDLPVLFPTSNSPYKLLATTVMKKYSTEPQNDFQREMRSWYGNNSKSVSGNSFRKTEKDFRIFEQMNQGDCYLEASKIADSMFRDEALLYGLQDDDNEDFNDLKQKRVPVYDREKFANRWKRLHEAYPSHTLVAHLSKDTYSHIHPYEPRGISVREAARLQSFPDEFIFPCSMGDAYKQIGNAVPPLLAYSIAQEVFQVFGKEKTDDGRIVDRN